MPGRRCRLALVIALIAGVVAMHHLAMGHGHDAGHGAPAAVAATVATQASAPAVVATPAPADAHGTAAMLHLCLAVLAGLLAAVVLVLATWWRRVPGGGPQRPRAPWRASRAPPVPVRLASLQLLRI